MALGGVPDVRSGQASFKVYASWYGTPNWSGTSQTIGCYPGTVLAADGWMFTTNTDQMVGVAGSSGNNAWLEVSFQDATSTVLALYRSAIFDGSYSANTWYEMPITNQYDPTTYAITNTVSTLVAPAGTTKVVYEVVLEQVTTASGGSVYADDLVLNQISGPVPPSVTSPYPDGTALFQSTNKLTFNAISSTTDIQASGIQVTVNGTDVSSQATVTGSARNWSVSVPLKTNQIYTASIKVTDTLGMSSTLPLTFDTFDPNAFLWEAENYDFNGGQFLDHPILSSTPQANSYFALVGMTNIDYYETTGEGDHLFRTNDTMATTPTTDIVRNNYRIAQQTDPNVQDYKVGWFNAGEWVNYTRTFPTGKFYVYARVDGSGNAQVDLSKVTSGWGTSNQTTALLGSFTYVGAGWSSYQWVGLTDTFGNMVAVDFNGQATLRAMTHGNADLNFFILVPAQLNNPVIGNMYPNGQLLFQPTNNLGFTVSSSSSTIPTGGIKVSLNGADVTSQLSISGTSLNKSVSIGILTNRAYTAVINVTDANGNTASSTVKFDTFNPNFVWDAEDWDYNNGQFVASGAPDAYANLSGVEGVDYHDINGTGTFPYRPSDKMSASAANDVLRTGWTGTNDYSLGYFSTGEWVNYTRHYPAGSYNVYCRLANGDTTVGHMSLSMVTNGAGTSSQSTSLLGIFNVTNTGGWGTYGYLPLRDSLGNLVTVTFPASGNTTLRLTRTDGSDANVNFLFLAPVRNDLPSISKLFPNGTTLLQGTNQLSFVAANPTVQIPQSGVQVSLNGLDVSSQLIFSGNANNWTVGLPLVSNVTSYTGNVRVTDNNSNVIAVTFYFDTFSAANFTWEAEDFDFEGGKFIDNPAIDAYANESSQYQVDDDPVTYAATGTFAYRPGDFIATQPCTDTPLPQFAAAVLTNSLLTNYNVGWLVTNSWMNYTHTYPAGNYFVYGRLAGGALNYNAQLDQIIRDYDNVVDLSTNHLGTFSAKPRGWQMYDWVPLTTNGQMATVTLGGKATLRFTSDGNENPNLFMLVPATGAVGAFRLTAVASGSGVRLSFATQSGHGYTVYYKAHLSDATWTPLTIVPGDGSVKTVQDNSGAAARFYRVSAQ